MPKVQEITNLTEKKIDLSGFFGEEAFITIKRLPKYHFTYLLNRSRNGYTLKMYELMTNFKIENPDKILDNVEYDKLRNSIPVDESENRITSESENDKQFFSHSILPDKHNFLNEKDKLINLDGSWFYDNYSALLDKDKNMLSNFLINEIISFNNTGLVLGEPTGLK